MPSLVHSGSCADERSAYGLVGARKRAQAGELPSAVSLPVLRPSARPLIERYQGTPHTTREPNRRRSRRSVERSPRQTRRRPSSSRSRAAASGCLEVRGPRDPSPLSSVHSASRARAIVVRGSTCPGLRRRPRALEPRLPHDRRRVREVDRFDLPDLLRDADVFALAVFVFALDVFVFALELVALVFVFAREPLDALDLEPLFAFDVDLVPVFDVDLAPVFVFDLAPVFVFDLEPVFVFDRALVFVFAREPLDALDLEPLFVFDLEPVFVFDLEPVFVFLELVFVFDRAPVFVFDLDFAPLLAAVRFFADVLRFAALLFFEAEPLFVLRPALLVFRARDERRVDRAALSPPPSPSPSSSSLPPRSFFATAAAAGTASPIAVPATTFFGVDMPSCAS